MKKLSSSLCGVAGEYFVAAELSRRGYIASVTLKNTKGVDVLVSSEDAKSLFGIQVKTNQNSVREWLLSKKAESFMNDDLLYIFVNINELQERPDFFVVPSKIVADYTKSTHKEWLETPGRGGRPHKDNSMRKFRDTDGKYLEKWEFLNII